MKNAKVRITRNNDFFGIVRKLNIYIDNKHVGSVGWNNSTDFAVSPGKHQLYVKMDWCRSKPLTFDINEKDLIEYSVKLSANESVFRFLKIFADLVFNFSCFYKLKRKEAS